MSRHTSTQPRTDTYHTPIHPFVIIMSVSWVDIVKGEYIKCMHCDFKTKDEDNYTHCCCVQIQSQQQECDGRYHKIRVVCEEGVCSDCGHWFSINTESHCCCDDNDYDTDFCTKPHFKQ